MHIVSSNPAAGTVARVTPTMVAQTASTSGNDGHTPFTGKEVEDQVSLGGMLTEQNLVANNQLQMAHNFISM